MGETATLILEVTVLPTGPYGNTAQVSSSSLPDPDSTPGNGNPGEDDQASATPTPLLVADLSITKTDGVAAYTPGGSATYTLLVTNHGPFDVSGATVSDPLPPGITAAAWTCAASPGSSCTGKGVGAIDDSVNLLSGGTAIYTFTLTIPADHTGDLVNTAAVSPPEGTVDLEAENDSAADTDTIAPIADLGITKTLETVGPFTRGQTISYTLVVSNAGPATATAVQVTDVATNLAISNVSGACTALPCTIASLAPGTSVTLTVRATILAGGPFDNVAAVSSAEADPNAANNSDEAGNGGVAGAVVENIPALSEIGLLLLGILMVLTAVAVLRRRRSLE